MRKKVSIIGAGNVGASIAQLVVYNGLADAVLFDIVEGMPQGKALDMAEAAPLYGKSSRVIGTNNYSDIDGSAIVVITAGIARKPGMSRDDLLNFNANVVGFAALETARYAPDAIIIVVTNPMDVMAQLAYAKSVFPKNRVMGMGGVLDSSRFRTFIAWELGVSVQTVNAMVLGGHGDQMVPLPSYTTVSGIPVSTLISTEKLDELIKRTRNGGAEIVGLLKSGSAYYAPAAASYEMIRAIILDEHKLLPASCYLDGEYGIRDTFAGVPAIIGEGGVERIVELPLTKSEKSEFTTSANGVRELVSKLSV